MSSLAQEESRSISENVTWGKRKSMEDGKFSLAYKRFLGYEKGSDGLPQIVEEEAGTVRKIYRMFLDGHTVRDIAAQLTNEGILTPAGKTNWSVSTIMSILQNEKYKGDALLQKTYTVDFLSKKVKKNKGEIPQYYIQNSHPAIIDPGTFELVQNEIRRRRPERRHLHKNSPFTAKIICGDCSGYYGRKTLHSNSAYRNRIWRCNKKYNGDKRCSTPNLSERDIEAAFVNAFNALLGDKEKYIAQFEELLPLLADTKKLEQDLENLSTAHSAQLENLRRYMKENTISVRDQEEYSKCFNEMSTACTETENKMKQVQAEILAQKGRKEQIKRSLQELRKCGDILDEFSFDLWNAVVETVTVTSDRMLTFRFQDGTEILVGLPDKK